MRKEGGKVIINLPEKVKYIIDTITAAGFEAYAVGGCIRDSILGRTPSDWDVTTSAKPSEVKQLFRRTIDTGIEHGTVTVMLDKEGFEITTYRIDGEYVDNRHPKEVIYTFLLIEDLKRRDLTINAMAYNEIDGLIDEFGGLQDIDKCVIKCVGDAKERFSEDALRIMRVVRFSAQLGYSIEENTKQAITQMVMNLESISAERIQVELVKLLVSSNPDYLRMAYETGVTAVILPEFDHAMCTKQVHPHHCYSVGEHILHTLTHVSCDKVLRLAALFHDIGKPNTMTIDKDGITHFYGHAEMSAKIAATILRRLRFDNDTTKKVVQLVTYHDYGNSEKPDIRFIRRAMNKIGEDIFPLLLQLKKADIMAQSDYMREKKLEWLASWEELYHVIIKEKQCVTLKNLDINGSDLIKAGVKPGKEIGELLNYLLDIVIECPEKNDKNVLLEILKNR